VLTSDEPPYGFLNPGRELELTVAMDNRDGTHVPRPRSARNRRRRREHVDFRILRSA